MQEMILTTDLTKSYKNVQAVDKVTLSVKKGEIYGFIGLNGAGKTTTIRMLLGMVRPTSGDCYLGGKKIQKNEYNIWEKVGYMVETPYSYPELTVKENLEITRKLRHISDKKTVEQVIDLLNLNQYSNRKAKQLSLGNAQRLGIAKALLHHPDILILDEPANGLDPAGIVEIRELLQDLAFNKGKTIFISSHILSEVAKIATKIGIIHNGILTQEVVVERLEQLLMKRLLINSKDNERARKILINAHFPAFIDHKEVLQICDNKAISHPDKIAELLVGAGCPPTMLMVEEEDLEAYFLRAIGLKGGQAL